jgi:two-component system response regulator MtrA
MAYGDADDAQRRRGNGAERLGALRVNKKRLLVIDDQVSLTKIISSIAAEAGLDVCVVNDPTWALDEFLNYRPNIVLLDMVMPEKDGVDVLQEIMLTGADAKVILTSGFTDAYVRLAERVVEFHNQGPVRHLKKPFRRNQLLAMLREVLNELAETPVRSA